MVQEELLENKNGLAVFNFKDMTTFKVVVKNADIQPVYVSRGRLSAIEKRRKCQNTKNYRKNFFVFF